MSADVKFVEETHTYFVDGIPVPSVTQIIAWHLGNPYTGVPEEVLQKAKDYGTGVHNAIENYIDTLEVSDYAEEVCRYAELEEKHDIQITSAEQIIHYGTRYAGRYDLLGTVGGKPAVVDVKTTYRLNREYLELQLGLYRMALQKPVNCFCAWLPKKGTAQLVEITPKTDEELEEILHAYEIAH